MTNAHSTSSTPTTEYTQDTTIDAFIDGFLRFLQDSPTPFHVVRNLCLQLENAGFTRLYEQDVWQLDANGRYFVTRNETSLIAFTGVTPPSTPPSTPITTNNTHANTSTNNALGNWRIVGAHTDSPCLKLKTNPERVHGGYGQCGVEVYGGALLHPWFDRDLSLAGQVHYRTSQGTLKQQLIDIKRPIACIPSLAIHLDRDANTNHTVNPQTHLPALLFTEFTKSTELTESGGSQTHHHDALNTGLNAFLKKTLGEQTGETIEHITAHDLSLYDTQPPARIGLHQEFVTSARLDNLLSCYAAAQALLDTPREANQPCLLIVSDHEEVGSQSYPGAQGNFLARTLNRLSADTEQLTRALATSLFISADNAHALHPNYADKHDSQHAPRLNQGLVLKTNANQRYATSAETQACFHWLCEQAGVQVQAFVMRSDMACGSTIGPGSAAALGVRTLDIGVAQLAMHSIRELAGVYDIHALYQVLCQFYSTPTFPFAHTERAASSD